jgi:hypothetical protein
VTKGAGRNRSSSLYSPRIHRRLRLLEVDIPLCHQPNAAKDISYTFEETKHSGYTPIRDVDRRRAVRMNLGAR